jgi:hypothetical protein
VHAFDEADVNQCAARIVTSYACAIANTSEVTATELTEQR